MATGTNFTKAVTLVEYTQALPEASMERAMLETFIEESDVMAALPIYPASNGKYSYPQEEALPTVQFRAYNEDGHESTGRHSRQEEGVFLMDEYVRVDRAEVDIYGTEERARQEAMKSKAMSRQFTKTFLSGDNATEPREPNGLQVRAGQSEQTTLHNSTSSGGAALSLQNIDAAINEVRKPTHIIMDRDMIPYLRAAARSPTLTNNVINMDLADPFGRKVLAYGELPILFGYPKSRDDSILPFAEVGNGGGSAVTSSLYVVSFGEDGCFAIEGTPLNVQDEGIIPGSPVYSTHIKWDWGFVSKEFSICRLDSFTKATIVA